MEEQQQSPENSTAAFVAQQQQPNIASKEAAFANEVPAPPGGNPYKAPPPPPPPPPPAYQPPAGAEQARPMFENVQREEQQQQQQEEQQQGPKRTPEYKRQVVMGFINAEDFFTANICGLIADTPASEFRSGQEEKDELLRSMEPFVDFIVEKCPAWLPVAAMYGMMKGQQIIKAVKTVKENKKREAAAKSPDTKAAVEEKLKKEAATGRVNFQLTTDGQYYQRTPDGKAYITKENLEEKPSIDDLDKILEKNPLKLVKLAFPELSTDELEKRKGF